MTSLPASPRCALVTRPRVQGEAWQRKLQALGVQSELLPLIRPLVPQYGHLAAVPSSNALIISDRRANIARLEELIRQLDQKNEKDYSVLNLRHAWVMDAA